MSKTTGAVETAFDHSEITDFLTKIIELGDYFAVGRDGLITLASSEDTPIIIKDKVNPTVKRKLYVYRTDIADPDAVILNPINELVSVGSEKRWFYQTISAVHSLMCGKVLMHLVSAGSKIKEDAESGDPVLMTALSSHIEALDAKCVDECKKIIDMTSVNDFMSIYYDKNSKSSRLRCCFQDKSTNFKDSFGSKIRKKTWPVLNGIMNTVFGVPDGKTIADVYTETTKLMLYPQFETTITVWIRAWKALIQYLPYIVDEAASVYSDLCAIELHMKQLSVYKDKSKWHGTSTSGAKTNTVCDVFQPDSAVVPKGATRPSDNSVVYDVPYTQVTTGDPRVVSTQARVVRDSTPKSDAPSPFDALERNYRSYDGPVSPQRYDRDRYTYTERRDYTRPEISALERSADDMLTRQQRGRRVYDQTRPPWDEPIR